MKINEDLIINNSNISLQMIANDSLYDATERLIGKFTDGTGTFNVYRQMYVFQLNGTYKEGGKTFTWYNPNKSFRRILKVYGEASMSNGYHYPANLPNGFEVCVDAQNRIQCGMPTELCVGQWCWVILEYTRN